MSIRKTNKTQNNRFAVGDIVKRRFSNNNEFYEIVGVRESKSFPVQFVYDLQECLKNEMSTAFERELELAPDLNKYAVPYHEYELHLANRRTVIVDVGVEEDWGDIQDCLPSDCEDWEKAVGWGNDVDGHKKIVKVVDMEDGSVWKGNCAICTWYEKCVSCYVDNYSS